MSESPAPLEPLLRLITDSLPVLIAYVDAGERYRFNNRAYASWFGIPPSAFTGKTVREALGDEAYGAVREDVAAALSGRNVTYEREIVWPDGVRRYVRGVYVPDIVTGGTVAGFALLVTDLSASRRLEQDRRTDARRQSVLIAAQQEIAGAERDLDDVLNIVVRRAQEMTEADGAAVEIAEGEDMVYRAASGGAAGHIGLRLRRDASLSGLCVAEGRLLTCEDAETDPRVDREACRRIGVRAMVVVPLQFLGRAVGALKVYSSRPNAFPAAVLPLLEMMVSLIIAAMSAVSEAEARRALSASVANQRGLLKDMLASVTDGRLHLCDTEAELPRPLALCGEPTPLLASGGLRPLRRAVQGAAEARGFHEDRIQDIVTAASEAGMNAVVHGGGRGEVRVCADADGVQVWVRDFGTGIRMENLPRAALSRGWSTKASLGHGLSMMLQMCDRLWLLTGDGGTTVVLEQAREIPLPAWL